MLSKDGYIGFSSSVYLFIFLDVGVLWDGGFF